MEKEERTKKFQLRLREKKKRIKTMATVVVLRWCSGGTVAIKRGREGKGDGDIVTFR